MGILSFIQESRTTKTLSKKISLIAVGLAIVAGFSLSDNKQVAAVDYGAEIKKLQTANSANEASRQSLQSSAATLEAKIASLQTTISALEGLIVSNESLRTDINQKIVANQAEIVREQEILKVSIRDLYISDDMSMLEKMASSRNLSDYVEKEQFTISAQDAVKDSMDRISALKIEQEKQKSQVETLISDSKSMQAQVASEKQQVAELLAQNQSAQAQESAEIAANNSQITDLQRQQAEENARYLREQAALAAAARQRAASSNTPVVQVQAPASSGIRAVNGAAYPWANAPWPNDLPDPWGMYQRQCVSYTAWKVSASGRHMPYWGGRGNANQWDDNARAAGIPTDGTPRVGDVAVRNAGTYGHVMYVEGINSDGSINISQYNADWSGHYSTATIMPSGLVFIHF
jgi:peptidoglycan DL-endopeptidase CwlO